MSAHTGSILCLNCLSFASSPDKNRDEEHATIIESLKAAKEMGAPSGAIVLQDYPWATAQGLDLLVKSLNEATGDAWEALRQWGSSQDENDECLADAVVLFDTAIYSLSGGVDKDSIGAFRDTDDLLAGVQDEIKAQLAGFVGRWAAAELSVVDASPPLAFLLVSYHGRGTLHVNGEFIPVQTAVKAAMSKDFIAQVADQIAERDHVPGLIAGCWNTDCVPLTADGGVQSGPGSKGAWATSVHVPHEVSKDKIGQPINPVDYAVAVHSAEGASTSADLKVVDVVALKHRADLASHFRHRPLLIKIEVAPKA